MTTDLQALELWRQVLTTSVRSEQPDLSARQMAIILTVYLMEKAQTVRGLAADLNISKPAVSRALDRLGELGFIRRKRDDEDRRNVLVQRTVKGSVFLSEFGNLVRDVSRDMASLNPANNPINSATRTLERFLAEEQDTAVPAEKAA